MALTLPTPAEFAQAAQYMGLATVGVGGLMSLGFVLKWGIRFRLFGVTAFMGVLTAGLFALGLTPLTRTLLPDAQRYTLVFDNGGTQAVIRVGEALTQTQLVATLQQAANDLFSYGRLAREDAFLTVRARVLRHPQPGLTEILYLGQARRSLVNRDDTHLILELDRENLARVGMESAPAS